MADEKHKLAALDPIRNVVPKFVELTEDVLYDDLWERPALSKRDRSLITIAVLAALNRREQLRFHLALGLDNGLTREEIGEEITHLAFYSGWPTTITAAMLAKKVFEEHK